MVKKEINKGYYNYTIEYDDSRFDIIYSNFSKQFVLMNKDNVVLGVFPRTIGFIKQVDVGSDTYFMVSNRVVVDNLYKHNVLEQYKVINNITQTLNVEDSSILDSLDYSKVVVSPSSFLVNVEKTNFKCIYSLGIGKKSRPFQTVIVDDRFRDIIGSSVLVEELIVASKYRELPDIYDVIIYGIDPVTLKITSKIYSKEQDRYIDLLSPEVIETKLRGKNVYKPHVTNYQVGHEKKSVVIKQSFFGYEYIEDEEDEIGSKTIYFEVVEPLEARIRFLGNGGKEINSFDDAIKDDFMKKIGKKEK